MIGKNKKKKEMMDRKIERQTHGARSTIIMKTTALKQNNKHAKRAKPTKADEDVKV